MNLTKYLIVTCAVLVAPIAQAMPITITSNYIGAAASDGGVVAEDFYSGTTIPTTVEISAVSGTSSSTNQINYSGNEDSVSLSVGMTHIIDNSDSGKDYSMAYDNILRFTANTTTTYSLSGFYDVIGTDTSAGMYVNLYDITSSSSLYIDFLETQVIDQETLNLGSGIGSLTGEIIAGHEYQFFFTAYIGDISESGSGASAIGDGGITLEFGSIGTSASAVVAIPEPGMLALMSLGLGLLVMRIKRS